MDNIFKFMSNTCQGGGDTCKTDNYTCRRSDNTHREGSGTCRDSNCTDREDNQTCRKDNYITIGLFNSYYRGDKQQIFYGEHGNELYWGDPMYRSTEYNRTDVYIRFLQTKTVKLQLVYSLHFAERKMYHQQSLYLSFDINNTE